MNCLYRLISILIFLSGPVARAQECGPAVAGQVQNQIRVRRLDSYQGWVIACADWLKGELVAERKHEGPKNKTIHRTTLSIVIGGQLFAASDWASGSNRRAADEAAASDLYEKVVGLESLQPFSEKYIVVKPERELPPPAYPFNLEVEAHIGKNEGDLPARNYRTWLNNLSQTPETPFTVHYVAEPETLAMKCVAQIPNGQRLETEPYSGPNRAESAQLAARDLYFRIIDEPWARTYYEKVGPPPPHAVKPRPPAAIVKRSRELTDAEISERIEIIRNSTPSGVNLRRLAVRKHPRVAYLHIYQLKQVDAAVLEAWKQGLKEKKISVVFKEANSWLENTGLSTPRRRDFLLREASEISAHLGRRKSEVSKKPSALPKDLPPYVDRRERDTFSIDPPQSPDIDDAISVGNRPERPLPEGQLWVGIHIAAVVDLVRPNGKMEKAALEEGTASYGRAYVKPIFDPEIAFDKASLLPSADRLAFTTFLRIDENNRIAEIELRPERSLIQNRRAYGYREVEKIIKGEKEDPRGPIFRRLSEATTQLFQMRTAGNVSQPHRRTSSSERLISELMILANVANAHFLQSSSVPFLRLVNPGPDEAETIAIRESPYANFLLSVLEPRISFPALETQEDEEEAINGEESPLRIPRASFYSATQSGHWNLRTPVYGHFTSPIRRASDYINQRQQANFLDAKSYRSLTQLKVLQPNLNFAIRRSRARKLRRMVALEEVQETLRGIGKEQTALVTSIENGQVFVTGNRRFPIGYLEPSLVWRVEGNTLEPEVSWQVQDSESTFSDQSGRSYHKGDLIQVVMTGLDLESEQMVYELANP